MNALNDKVNAIFPGRVVRKDLVQRVKKGTNAPTFVLEFLLARYCATDDPDEIEAGLAAVNETLQGNFVRPNESNAAQSLVQQKGSHKFIDKVRVTHNEKERRHWAEMENFGSRRIAINDSHYRGNPRLLEGGLWCEVVVGYNYTPGDDEEDYTFHIEELRPIQVSRFDFDSFVAERGQFTTDEWRALILRSIGMEADNLTPRQPMHYLGRLLPLVEANYNFIELGPRGTGKSYTFSEFSPYSTLISGGQTTTATLFYNKTRRQVGIIGYWDNIAFDEVAGIKGKDPGTIQILKDYMANGRFSLGTEVIAPASLAFIGNIDDSISEIVRSVKHDLFKPLPAGFDLAVIHRFHMYLPGWEIPSNADNLLKLICNDNRLTELDLSSVPNLTVLECSGNQLVKLDLSAVPHLRVLGCGGSQLTDLDLSPVPHLTKLSFGHRNGFFGRNSCAKLSKFDLSAVPLLTDLYCVSAELTELDLSSSKCLTILKCDSNHLTELDLSAVPRLIRLSCNHNHLARLDLSSVADLTSLECSRNDLTELNLSAVSLLAELSCRENQLTELDLSGSPKLTVIDCGDNRIAELDLSAIPNLTELVCIKNHLAKLDLSSVPRLEKLICGGNQLTKLTLLGVPNLKKLYCCNNQLTKIDLATVPQLTHLSCQGNQLLTDLDISPLNYLTSLEYDKDKVRLIQRPDQNF